MSLEWTFLDTPCGPAVSCQTEVRLMSGDTSGFCPQCGKPTAVDAVFCEQCGARLEVTPEPPPVDALPSVPLPPAPETAAESGSENVLLAWEVGIPMVTNPFFLWDMAKLWGISCGVLFLIMCGIWLPSRDDDLLRFAFIVPSFAFVGFFLFSMLIALVFFFNRYYALIVLSTEGVSYEMARWSRTLSRAVSNGNIVLGVLTASPQGIAAGMVGEMQRSVLMEWGDIRKVSFFPGLGAITLSNSWRPVLRLRCPTDELFARARQVIEREVPANGGTLRRS